MDQPDYYTASLKTFTRYYLVDRAVKIASIKSTLKLDDYVDLLRLTLKVVDYEKLTCSTHLVAFM
mgnify:CR=1 FL=1